MKKEYQKILREDNFEPTNLIRHTWYGLVSKLLIQFYIPYQEFNSKALLSLIRQKTETS